MGTVFTNARVVCISDRAGPRVGVHAAMPWVLPIGQVRVEAGRVAEVGVRVACRDGDERIDLGGRVLAPGFVDCHTHACWAGSRLDEWQSKLEGVEYLELLRRGGGIMSTVRAVRSATRAELAERLLARLERMGAEGTVAAEVKSGYGLDARTELKMLEAIAEAASRWRGHVVPTACIGHAIDPEIDDHPRHVVREVLPEVSRCFPGVCIDAYCERGAWSVDDTFALAQAAAGARHPVRLHVDQFTSLGLIERIAADVGLRDAVRSVDHLEASSAQTLACVARSGITGVLLPASGLHLDQRYADGRRLLDAGGRVAVATNYNPGSSPCFSMPMAMSLAVRFCGLSPNEAWSAATVNAAHVLGLADAGRIAPGARANLIELEATDERTAAFEFGGRMVRRVFWADELK